MTYKEMNALQYGDIVSHKGEEWCYICTVQYDKWTGWNFKRGNIILELYDYDIPDITFVKHSLTPSNEEQSTDIKVVDAFVSLRSMEE